MGSLSVYADNKLVDHVFKTTSYTPPTNIYVALSTTLPTAAGGNVNEPSGNAYARTVCNTWNASSSSATANTGAVVFPTATGSWGTVTYAALFDASTSGNPLMYGALGTSQAVVSGNVVEFDAAAITPSIT